MTLSMAIACLPRRVSPISPSGNGEARNAEHKTNLDNLEGENLNEEGFLPVGFPSSFNSLKPPSKRKCHVANAGVNRLYPIHGAGPLTISFSLHLSFDLRCHVAEFLRESLDQGDTFRVHSKRKLDILDVEVRESIIESPKRGCVNLVTKETRMETFSGTFSEEMVDSE
jgi:hypothetical protein